MCESTNQLQQLNEFYRIRIMHEHVKPKVHHGLKFLQIQIESFRR